MGPGVVEAELLGPEPQFAGPGPVVLGEDHDAEAHGRPFAEGLPDDRLTAGRR